MAAHHVIFNSSGHSVKCLTGKVAIQKAQLDITHMTGYVIKQYAKKESCPHCNKKTLEVGEEPEKVDTSDFKEGQCRTCKGSHFKLKIVNHSMVRECHDCKALFDLVKLMPISKE